jgi:hypothetical protein
VNAPRLRGDRNIGPRHARARLLAGIGAILASVALGLTAVRHDGSTWIRVVALAGLFLGALGVLQAACRT